MEISSKIDETLAKLEPSCFLCGWILKDIKENGKLTGWPHDYTGAPIFTKKGQLRHLVIEGIAFNRPIKISEIV